MSLEVARAADAAARPGAPGDRSSTLGLWLLLAVAWFATFSLRPVLDPDESRYAEIPREMVATGDWVTPRLNGGKYFEKPVLQYWATATAYTIFGVSDGASRLWTVALAFLCLPMVSGFARAIGAAPGVAARAPLLLAVNPYFALLGQINLLDQAFAFFCCATLFAFVLSQLAPRRSTAERNWMLLAWAGLALAVLSKGIAAIALTGATLVAYMLVERDASPLRRMHFLLGVPTFLAIAAPWFWIVQLRNPEFAGFFFVHEHFARFLTKVHRRDEPFWYFVPLLLFAILPVLGVAKRAVALAWRDAATPAGTFKARRFLLLWCAVTVLFFSVSQSKLAPYILPAMPPLALLLAAAITDDPRAARRAAWVVLAILCTAAIGLVVYGWRRNGAVDPSLAGWAALALGIALLPFLAGRRGAGPEALPGAALGLRTPWLPVALASVIGLQALTMAYAALPPSRSAKALASAVARDAIGPDTVLFSVAQYRPSVSFYLARNLRLVAFKGELEFGIGREDLGYIDDLQSFNRIWTSSVDAVAVVDPKTYAALRDAGLPGRVLAASDGRSIVVSRR